jgi:hypothetical protein
MLLHIRRVLRVSEAELLFGDGMYCPTYSQKLKQ